MSFFSRDLSTQMSPSQLKASSSSFWRWLAVEDLARWALNTVHLRFCSVMTPYWLSLHCPLIHELWVICRCIKSLITKGSFMPLSMWTWRRQTPRQWRATRMRLSTSTSSSNTATRSSSCMTSEFVVIVVFCFQHVSRLLSWYYVLKVQSGISMQYSFYLFLGVKFSEIL